MNSTPTRCTRPGTGRGIGRCTGHRTATAAAFVVLATALTACGPGSSDATHAADAESAATGSTNAVAIPSAVRSNLGISFVTVERRRIEQTLRVPGRFEYLPTARREYRTMLPGRIELLVDQFDRVADGQPLFRIDAPGWREMQQNIAGAESTILSLETRLASFAPLRAAHARHEASLLQGLALRRTRVEQLESVREAGGGRTEALAAARSEFASAEAGLANVQEKVAELEADRVGTEADLAAARSRLAYLIDAAAAVSGRPRDWLLAADPAGDGRPHWATLPSVTVTAVGDGVVATIDLTNGTWADGTDAVLTIVQPDRLRFHASGLQSDLGALRDGLSARIVPPSPTTTGRAVSLQDTMSGRLALGLAGDADDRTIDLFVTPETLAAWARPGVAAQLEIVTDETPAPELAIPLAAIQRDGLLPVIFRRNPDNGDEAIRLEGDLGPDDGRWIAVYSGLRDGDEIVLDGAFQLMLATSGSMQQGGHFHSDGTFHEEDH